MRSVNSYEKCHVLDVYRDTAAIGLRRGSYDVIAVDPKNREVKVQSGSDVHSFRPERLHPNASGLSLSQPDQISVRTGDVLHWTASDNARGISSGQTVTLSGHENGRLSFVDGKGQPITLDASDPMTQRIDHTLVLNMHKAQGITVENAIAVMQSGDRMLNNQSLAYVLTSRAREGFELHLDSRDAIIEQLEGNNGMQHSAMDVADSAKGRNEAEKASETAVEGAMERATPPSLALETPELEKTRDFDIS